MGATNFTWLGVWALRLIKSNIILLTVRTHEWKRNGFSHTFTASTHYYKNPFCYKNGGKIIASNSRCTLHLSSWVNCTRLNWSFQLIYRLITKIIFRKSKWNVKTLKKGIRVKSQDDIYHIWSLKLAASAAWNLWRSRKQMTPESRWRNSSIIGISYYLIFPCTPTHAFWVHLTVSNTSFSTFGHILKMVVKLT